MDNVFFSQLNHGKECLCSTGDKQKWIVHNVYPNEQVSIHISL
jgi:hypothetical protein